jgi:LacI family transcriptional regulator
VAAYDDHPIARVVSPGLTSVDWGLRDVAAAASALLSAAVEGHPRRGARARVRIAPSLVLRASTAPVPA